MDAQSACMEEMRAASYPYYDNLTEDHQRLVLNLYQALDSDGNGTVSRQECWDFLSTEGYTSHLPPDLFEFLDINRNGILDFYEFITLLYMIKSNRLVKCDGACGKYLWGTYFLCVQCYETGNRTYDLCCYCYRHKRYAHGHSLFMDNYALLRKKWLVAPTTTPIQGPIQKSTYGRVYSCGKQVLNHARANSFSSARANSFSSFGKQGNTGNAVNGNTNRREKIQVALEALNLAINIASFAATGASIAATGCNIM